MHSYVHDIVANYQQLGKMACDHSRKFVYINEWLYICRAEFMMPVDSMDPELLPSRKARQVIAVLESP